MKRSGAAQAKGNRAVGYIRVSDESQVEGYSLDAQRKEITRWCERHGHKLTGFYADEGVSAHTDNIGKRPQMVKLLEDAKQNTFDCVAVHMLDRWARNVGIQRQALKQLGECSVGFASVTEDIDFTTPAGRLMLTTLGGVAEFFSDQLGLHVQKAHKQRAELGLQVGAPPFGYSKVESNKVPQVDQRESLAIKEAFQRRAEGKSYGDIGTWLNNQGLRTRKDHAFTAHAVKDLLNSHYYCGYIKHNEVEYKGQQDAIVPEKLFQRVQVRRLRREIVRSVHGPKGLLQGIVACSHCGNGLQSDRHRQKVPMYRERHAHECPTNNTSIMAGPIDRQISTVVHSLEFKPDWKKKMAELTVANYDGPKPEILRDKRRRLGKAYADGAFTDEEYNRRLTEIDRQLQQASTITNPAIEEAAELFSNIPMLWNEATTEERRILVKSLVEEVFIDIKSKYITAVKPTPAFRALFGVGIDVGPDTPIDLQAPERKIKDIVGVGGGGGGLNSPSRRRLPEPATSLVSLLSHLTVLC